MSQFKLDWKEIQSDDPDAVTLEYHEFGYGVSIKGPGFVVQISVPATCQDIQLDLIQVI